MEDKLRTYTYYILSKLGCIHLYRASRILVLANWRSIERRGNVIVNFSVSGFEGGFSIDELAELKNDKCIEVDKELKCMRYICSPPQVDSYSKEILDEVIRETRELDDIALNRLVIRDERYKELLSKGGFS